MFTYGTDPNGDLISSPAGGDTVIDNTQVWTRIDHTFNLSSLSAMNYFSIALERTSAASGEIIFADAFLVEKSGITGSYFDGSTSNGFWTGAAHNSFSGGDPYS